MKNYINFLLLLTLICYNNSVFAQMDSCIVKIYFKTDDFTLNDSSKKILLKTIKENSGQLQLTIIGRTDQFGSYSYNDILSLKRANAVTKYLIANGIDSNKISEVIGFGKRKLLTPAINKDKISSQLNRVVSIINTKSVIKTKIILDSVKKIIPDSTKNNIIVEKQKVYNNDESNNSFQNQLNNGASRIILNNLNFEPGRHVLLRTSYPVLHEVLLAMQNNDSLEIEIQGHICCLDSTQVDGVDNDTHEKTLSKNRAEVIYEYLLSNGIAARRMTYKGFGAKHKLVFPERTEFDATMNRRVEFKIIKR